MQQTALEKLWLNLLNNLRNTVNTETFVIDLLSAAAVMVAAWLVIILSRKVSNRVLAVPSTDEEGKVIDSKVAQTLRILIDTLLSYAVYAAAVLGILHIFNIDIINMEDLKGLTGRVIQSLIIFAVAKAVLRVSNVLIDHWFAEDKQPLIGKKRVNTLRALLLSVLRYAVYFIAGVMVLQTFGVQTGSIIASAGIAGLAVGFGAQDLVKDVISGFFILFEDQFSVGEYVTVAGITGTVEELGLRSTTVREWTGHRHTIPNGEIGKVKNFDRGPILAVVIVGIAYQADVDRAIEVINGTLEKVFNEQENILSMPKVLGVNALNDFSVDLLITAECRSGNQWAIERELRRRIKQDLDLAGIDIPFPTRIIYHRTEQDGQQVVIETDSG